MIAGVAGVIMKKSDLSRHGESYGAETSSIAVYLLAIRLVNSQLELLLLSSFSYPDRHRKRRGTRRYFPCTAGFLFVIAEENDSPR